MEKKNSYKLVFQTGVISSFSVSSDDDAVTYSESLISAYKKLGVVITRAYLWRVISSKPNRYSLVYDFEYGKNS